MLKTENNNKLKVNANKLQIFQNNDKQNLETPLNQREQTKGFWKFFTDVVDEFVENSTIPGLDRIFKSNLHVIKRSLWLTGFIISMLFFIYISMSIAHIQQTKPLVTVVSSTHYPVYKIPFPEVTICNKNRLNWQRYEQAKEKFLKIQHHDTEYEEIFMEVINAYDTLTFGEFNKFENIIKVPREQLQDLNYINFTLVVEFMAWKCYEIFSECKWLDHIYNCCDIFYIRKSQLGFCLAFNSIESPEGMRRQAMDPFWPWRASGRGIKNGLKVKVHISEYLHSPKSNNAKGIMFMLAEPYVWYYHPLEVGTHTKTTVAFKGILHFFDNYTRFYSSDIRQCVFEDELHSMYYKSLENHRYMYENCQAECEQEYLNKFCNCSVDLFYPPGSYKSCKLSDLPCLFKHNGKFQYFEQIGEVDFAADHKTDVMKCLCYMNCKSLNYITNVNAAYMTNVDLDVNNSYIDIAFNFQDNFIMVYKTTVTYTWTDLMSGLGGLAGLCIGCSLLSIIELFYFFLVDIPKQSFNYLKTRKNSKLHCKSQGVKLNIIEEMLDE